MATVIPFPRPQRLVQDSPERGWTGALVDLDAARAMAQKAGATHTDHSEQPEKPEQARQLAIRALALKGRSVEEIRTRLRERGIDQDLVETEIARLESEGLINDQVLAEDLADTLHRVKKMGPSAIRQALLQRSIPREIVDSVVSELPESTDALRELAEARMRQLSAFPPEVASRRLIGFLARRGYTGHEVYRTVDALLASR